MDEILWVLQLSTRLGGGFDVHQNRGGTGRIGCELAARDGISCFGRFETGVPRNDSSCD